MSDNVQVGPINPFFVNDTAYPDNVYFTIEGDALTAAAIFNAEDKDSYSPSIMLLESSGALLLQELTITITDLNEAPSAEDDSYTLTVGNAIHEETECGPLISYTVSGGEPPIGSVGKVIPYLECRIHDPDPETGVGEVQVELVWDPPWTPEMMTEEARLELGMV